MMHDEPHLNEGPPAPRRSSPERLEHLLAQVSARSVDAPPGWRDRLRELPTSTRALAAVAAALTVAALHFTGFPLRDDLADNGLLRVTLADLALVAIAAAGVALALRPAHRPPWPRAVALVLLAVATATPLVPGWWPGVHVEGGAPARVHAACGLISLLVGGAWFAALRALDRSEGDDPARAYASAAAGAALGVVVTLLHCRLADPEHLLLGHSLTAAALVAGQAAYRRLSPPPSWG